MQDEKKRKQFIQNTIDTVAQDYGLGACRFFRLSGEIMAELLDLSDDESILDVASGTGATALPLARKLPKGPVTGHPGGSLGNLPLKVWKPKLTVHRINLEGNFAETDVHAQ